MNLKVLIVSRNAWDNKAGNTLSNFFQEFEPNQLAQIYCRDELPDNDLCEQYFCISEKKLFKSIFTKKYVGERIFISKQPIENQFFRNAEIGTKFYSIFRNYRFTLLLWIRELIWEIGKWKGRELENFITEFHPDIIYTDSYDTLYTYKVLRYVRDVSKVPYVMFHCDDHLTFKKFSISPLFWLNRLFLNLHVRTAIKHAALNYCIVDEQLRIYKKIIPTNYKILNKCADFTNSYTFSEINKPIKLIYAGNLHLGRWKTLAQLAKYIREINKDQIRIELEIYTGKTVSKNKLKRILTHESIYIHNYIPYDELIEKQKKADILLHVESFDLKERLITYLSFSTKIVDFFEMGKCVLAIGWKGSAPIKYLSDKDAALVVTNKNELITNLFNVVNNPAVISDYAIKSRKCGQLYHDKSKVLSSFYLDLVNIAKSKI